MFVVYDIVPNNTKFFHFNCTFFILASQCYIYSNEEVIEYFKNINSYYSKKRSYGCIVFACNI